VLCSLLPACPPKILVSVSPWKSTKYYPASYFESNAAMEEAGQLARRHESRRQQPPDPAADERLSGCGPYYNSLCHTTVLATMNDFIRGTF